MGICPMDFTVHETRLDGSFLGLIRANVIEIGILYIFIVEKYITKVPVLVK